MNIDFDTMGSPVEYRDPVNENVKTDNTTDIDVSDLFEESKSVEEPTSVIEDVKPVEEPKTFTSVLDENNADEESETRKMAVDFMDRYLNLQLEIKRVKEDIKALRREFEEQGIPTRICIKAINDLRKELKDTDGLMEETQTFKSWFGKSAIISNKVTELDAKG